MVRLVLYPAFADCESFAPLQALERLGEQLFVPLRDPGISVKSDHGGCICDRRGGSVSTKLRKRRSSADELAVSADSPQFAVACDVRGYAPEEIRVKAVGSDVLVSGKHEREGDDGGYLKMEFARRFTLPEGVDSEAVTCRLLASGVLAIEAPKAAPPCKKPRVIPITVESSPRAVAEEARAAEKPESESGEAAPAS